MSKRNGETVQATKPQIKRVNYYEVYLVDSRGRKKKRICGVQKNNMPQGYVCTNPAGADTDHPGIAQCSFHDRQITNPTNINLWARLNLENKLPVNLMELLESTKQIEETEMVRVDDEIRLLYALQGYLMSRAKPLVDEEGNKTEEGYLSSDNIELLMKLSDKILKAKDLRVRLNKELVLDTASVKSFVNQIFKIISEQASEAIARGIMVDIMEEVIVPFKTKGRMRGADLTFDEETGRISDAEEVD